MNCFPEDLAAVLNNRTAGPPCGLQSALRTLLPKGTEEHSALQIPMKCHLLCEALLDLPPFPRGLNWKHLLLPSLICLDLRTHHRCLHLPLLPPILQIDVNCSSYTG